MSVTPTSSDPFVILYGIPWEMYENITDALGEYHLRHTYVEGTLEMRGLLYGVTWQAYSEFLDALGDYSLRHTYDRGALEMMSPRKDHDWPKRLIGRMIETMCYECDISIQSIGSTTLTGEAVERGLQPDEAYYIANEPLVRGKSTFDPDQDPPPDLVVEVDVTSSSVKRLPSFAALGVPEVWRYTADKLTFHCLNEQKEYEEAARSRTFGFLAPEDLTRFLDQHQTSGENSIIRAFVDWARLRREGQSD